MIELLIPLDVWLFELFDDFYMFTVLVVFLMLLIGMASGTLAVGALGAYVTFAHIAVETQDEFLLSVFYVSFVVVIIGFSFKIWRLEFGGET